VAALSSAGWAFELWADDEKVARKLKKRAKKRR
jgi:hypothetical protein